MDLKAYQRDCLLGTLSGLLMLAGDLCLSVVPYTAGDSGLFAREAYLTGGFQVWRLPLLLATGLVGMALAFFTVRASCRQIKPQYRKTRWAVLTGGVIYAASAGVLHFLIGSLADWTGTLAPLLGREKTLTVIQAQYERLMPPMLIAYAGMVLLILAGFYALLTKKTFLPQRMVVFHVLVWQLVLMLIPDIRQLLGARLSTWDFVLSQGSGNAALCIWMAANAVWAGRQRKRGAMYEGL